MLAVLLSLALSSPPNEEACERVRCGRVRERPSSGTTPALFEFAPASGAGMGTACACTTPTGSKGEALTFTRASSGTCLKGNTTSSIANGDLVTCTNDQPRVMPGGAGTGALGLLVEPTRTNLALRSEAFDNAAWTKGGGGTSVAPTVTADQATAPDGTLTADRVQFPASATGTDYSTVSQTFAAGAYAGGVFLKGNASSGSLFIDCHGGAADNCATCSYNATTWSRCSCTAAVAASPTLLIGNYPIGCAGGAMPAADVFLWGGSAEAGAFITSYIATAGATVTRATEADTLPLVLTNTTGSIAATIVTDHTALAASSDYGIVSLSAAGPVYKQLLDYNYGSTAVTLYFPLTAVSISENLLANTPFRWAGWWDTGSINAIRNSGTAATAAATTTAATTLVELGTYNAIASPPAFVIKQVCVDSSPTRCR